MANEVLAHAIGDNVTCVIDVMYKMGINSPFRVWPLIGDGQHQLSMVVKQPTRPWVKDVKAFAVATAVSMVLTGGLIPLAPYLDSCGFPRLAEGLILAIAAPALFARECQAGDFVFVLLALNPLIYGLMWWFLWKMVHLFRAKPTERDSLPPHNE